MSVSSLVWGLVVLLALLVLAGTLGGVGTVELAIWLVLVAMWILWWARARSHQRHPG
jgi:hypothetical protein